MAQKAIVKIINCTLRRLYNFLGRLYLAPLLYIEAKRPAMLSEMDRTARRVNERPLELGFALRHLTEIAPKNVLDVGAGQSSWPHTLSGCGFNVTAVDKISAYWKGVYFNRHFHIINDDITQSKLQEQFDFITCISVIEHIPNHLDAFDGMFKRLEPGGHLLITCPYNETRYVENVYTLPEASYGKNEAFICQVLSREQIDTWMKDKPATIVQQEYYQVFTGELWTFGERLLPMKQVDHGELCHLTCLLIQKHA